jgi:hypothetical protein
MMLKPIEGLPGIFVSDEGYIVSELRDHRVLKSGTDSKGYQRVRVTVNRQKCCLKVHREVAKAFVPNPENKPQVNHIDGDKSNNAASNLEWVTNKENARHAMKNGLWENVFAASKKTNQSRMRPVKCTVLATGEEILYESMAAAGKATGVSYVFKLKDRPEIVTKGYRFVLA